jgi:DNA-directed RNA polymerase subunit RPC12/RpoP
MSESAGNWATCPECGNRFFAMDSDDEQECDECGATF